MSDQDYLKCIKSSESVSWKIEEVLPEDYKFDFEKRFLPVSLTLEDKLTFLNQGELLDLNHIRSASYINLFAFVEEYITAFMVQTASESIFNQNNRLRAFLRFSEEEVKHQTLFMKYIELFNANFKVKCEFLSGADELANVILSNSKFSVLLLTYHLEVITQQHYLESIKTDTTLEEGFSLILKKHWQEEAQHAKLDLSELLRLARDFSQEEILASLHEYFNVLDALKELLKKQVDMDFDSLSKCTKRAWSPNEKKEFLQTQYSSYLHNFILLGLNNKKLRKEMRGILKEADKFLEEKANFIEKELHEANRAA